MQFIPVMAKLNFQHYITDFLFKKHFLILLLLKTVVLLNIFVETMIIFFQGYLKNRKFKRTNNF